MIMMRFAAMLLAAATAATAANAEPFLLKKKESGLAFLSASQRLFDAILQCYPQAPLFDAALTLRLSKGTVPTGALEGNAFAGLVLDVPLYSTQERFRALHEESQRRELLGQSLALLDKAVAVEVKAARLWEIYRAVGVRSAQRVKDGFAPLDEQVGYYERESQALADWLTAKADTSAARLKLTAWCTDAKRPAIDRLVQQRIEEMRDAVGAVNAVD